MSSPFVSSSFKGLSDWITQRLTALYIGIYFIFIMISIVCLPSEYIVWRHFFANFWVMLASILMILAISWHAWIGVWTIITDYVKPIILRSLCHLVAILLLLTSLIWGMTIFLFLFIAGGG